MNISDNKIILIYDLADDTNTIRTVSQSGSGPISCTPTCISSD
jgi:hypothetical protein